MGQSQESYRSWVVVLLRNYYLALVQPGGQLHGQRALSGLTFRAMWVAIKILLILGGLGLAIWGIILAFKPKTYTLAPGTVWGTVIGFDVLLSTRGVGEGSDKEAPIYSYEYNGVQYRGKTDSYTSPRLVAMGQQVPVWVNPNNPAQSKLLQQPSGWAIFGTAFIMFGGFLFLLGVMAVPMLEKMFGAS